MDEFDGWYDVRDEYYSDSDYYREPWGLDPNDDYKWGYDEEDEIDPAQEREDFGWFGEMGIREE